jgi:hypothetical protein
VGAGFFLKLHRHFHAAAPVSLRTLWGTGRFASASCWPRVAINGSIRSGADGGSANLGGASVGAQPLKKIERKGGGNLRKIVHHPFGAFPCLDPTGLLEVPKSGRAILDCPCSLFGPMGRKGTGHI